MTAYLARMELFQSLVNVLVQHVQLVKNKLIQSARNVVLDNLVLLRVVLRFHARNVKKDITKIKLVHRIVCHAFQVCLIT